MPCVSRLPRSQSKVTFQAQPSGEPEAPELSTVKPSTPARRPCSGCWASPCPRAHQCAPADPSRGARGPVAVGAGEAQGRTPACPSQQALSPGLPVRPCAPETPAPSSTEPPVQGQPPPWDPFRDGKEGTGSSALAAAWPAPGPGLLLGAPPRLAGRFPHLPECPLPSPTSAASPRGPCPSSAGTSHSDAVSPGPLLTLLGREVHLQTAGGHTGTSLRPTVSCVHRLLLPRRVRPGPWGPQRIRGLLLWVPEMPRRALGRAPGRAHALSSAALSWPREARPRGRGQEGCICWVLCAIGRCGRDRAANCKRRRDFGIRARESEAVGGAGHPCRADGRFWSFRDRRGQERQ
ncbi:uncharacterized protein LOC144298672 [Canis aureus]